MNIKEFYDPKKWTRGFGAYGSAYTIVHQRHIGLDVAHAGGTVVPSLWAGVVVLVTTTTQLGGIVVIDIGRGLYVTYCHLAKRGRPSRGDRISVGSSIGYLAKGPLWLPQWLEEFPGKSWGGPHTHIVVSTHPNSAYDKIVGHRTLAAFRDPAPLIRGILATPSGGGGGEAPKPPVPAPDPIPTIPIGEGDMKNWTVYRNMKTGEIVIVTGRESVSVDEKTYSKVREIMALQRQRDPQGGWPTFPDINRPDDFFNLDDFGWGTILALVPHRPRK